MEEFWKSCIASAIGALGMLFLCQNRHDKVVAEYEKLITKVIECKKQSTGLDYSNGYLQCQVNSLKGYDLDSCYYPNRDNYVANFAK